MRVGLERLKEILPKEENLTAILPTGYGKTRFFKQNKDLLKNLGKTIHALPLQAIVSDFYQDMKGVLGDDVGYQMALSIPDADKRPYLSRKYMITTIDSFLLDFYGIPVHEIFRSKWHSDLALLFARTSNIILDEYHLVTAVDVDDADREFAKVISVVEDIRKSSLKKFIIFTATLPRQLIKTKSLVLAPDGHPFLDSSRGMEAVWDPNDDFISVFSDYTNRVKTFIDKVEKGKKIKKIKDILRDNKGRKILIILNHIRDVEKVATELKAETNCYFVHGLFTYESKQRLVNKLPNCLVATQVIEAGVNLSFDILITDIAPAFSLIQRAGRILRGVNDITSKNGEIHILVDNVEEQVKGVYDLGITKKTLELLEKASNINWRLPEKERMDYLRLIMGIEQEIESVIKHSESDPNVKNFLTLLSNIILSPQKIIGNLDELFHGSFIRSSSLIPMVVRGETASVSWERFLKIIKEAKELQFSYLLLDTNTERTVKVTAEDIIDKRPLTTMLRILRRIRREEKVDEDSSGFIKIAPKGFICPDSFIGEENIGEDKLYYIKG